MFEDKNKDERSVWASSSSNKGKNKDERPVRVFSSLNQDNNKDETGVITVHKRCEAYNPLALAWSQRASIWARVISCRRRPLRRVSCST